MVLHFNYKTTHSSSVIQRDISLQGKCMLMKRLWLILPLLFILSCEDDLSKNEESHEYKFEHIYLDTGITEDNKGYFHITLDRNRWQTIYRVRGIVYRDDIPVELVRFDWESNLYWIIGDTLGYVVKRGLTDQLQYVSYDTVYITQYNGFTVPTSNTASYSNAKGEVSNMIAPVNNMVGDTLILTWEFFAEDKLHDGKIEFVLE